MNIDSSFLSVEPKQSPSSQTKKNKSLRKVIPGTFLAKAILPNKSGPGTYVMNNNIYSSLCGKAMIHFQDNFSDSNPTINIYSVVHNKVKRLIPQIGDIVLARCIKTANHKATFQIESIESGSTLQTPIFGEISVTDIRRIVTDKVTVSKSFSVGDLVRCKVTALGSSKYYVLSSASQELGVIEARSSKTLEKMIPISWQEMQCPLYGTKEYRKVAKPDTENESENK